MSRTYRKGPTWLYKYQGTYYESWEDLPHEWETVTRERKVPIRWEEQEVTLSVWRVDWNEQPPRYYREEITSDVLVPVEWEIKKYTRRYVKKWLDYEVVTVYDQKKQRQHKKGFGFGVGKEWKNIREGKHRARTKQALHRCLKEDPECVEFPVNKTCDRWNYW